MKKIFAIISVFLVLAFAISAMAAEFNDVPTGHWAYGSISRLADKGVINGVGDGMYAPDGILTRAQFIKLLVCAMDMYDENEDYTPMFDDTAADMWYTPYAAIGVDNSIVEEKSKFFYPEKAMKRGEAVVWMMNALGSKADEACTFSDVTDSKQKGAVGKAVALGLINGYNDATFRPDNTLTRAEAATIIERLMTYRTGGSVQDIGKYDITITVVDNGTGNAVKGARVFLNTGEEVLTDENGKAEIYLKADQYAVGIQCKGYLDKYDSFSILNSVSELIVGIEKSNPGGYYVIKSNGKIIDGKVYYIKGKSLYEYCDGKEVCISKNVGYSVVTDLKGYYYVSDKALKYKNCDGTGERTIAESLMPQSIADELKKTYGAKRYETYLKNDYKPYVLGVYNDRVCISVASEYELMSGIALDYVAILDAGTGEFLMTSKQRVTSGDWIGPYFVGYPTTGGLELTYDMSIVDTASLNIKTWDAKRTPHDIGIRENGFYYWADKGKYPESETELRFYDFNTGNDYAILQVGNIDYGSSMVTLRGIGAEFAVYKNGKSMHVIDLKTCTKKKLATNFDEEDSFDFIESNDGNLYFMKYVGKSGYRVYKITSDSVEAVGTTKKSYGCVLNGSIVAW